MIRRFLRMALIVIEGTGRTLNYDLFYPEHRNPNDEKTGA